MWKYLSYILKLGWDRKKVPAKYFAFILLGAKFYWRFCYPCIILKKSSEIISKEFWVPKNWRAFWVYFLWDAYIFLIPLSIQLPTFDNPK